jgi:hypothetical protein
MRRLPASILCLAVLLALTGSPSAAPQRPETSYVSALSEARSALVGELEGLAAQAKRGRLQLEADLCYRRILVLEPDHGQARKALRYSKRNGEWVQSASYRQPRNFGDDELEAFVTARDAVLEGHKEHVFELGRRYEETTTLEQRERSLLRLLELMPDDAEVRAALGEGWVNGEWRLLETATALERRALIPELAKRCVLTAPPGDEVEPGGLEQAIGLDFALILETPYVRVAGTGDPDEVRNVLAITQGAGEFFRTLLSNQTLPRVGFQIFLLANPGEKRHFLDHHPRVKARDRPYLESLESAGIPGTGQTAEWSTTATLRLDRSTRQTVGAFLTDTYGISTEHGWAWEGIGIYLTYQLTGTRLTYYIRPDRYGGDPNASDVQKQLFARLFQAESEWIDEARLFFVETGHRPPGLASLMGRAVDSMSAQDMLWSYVLAAYLIEGWPDHAPAFLTEIGGGTAPHDAVRRVFGMELPRFQDRLARWVGEAR